MKRFYLIGRDIASSLSPPIHRQIFASLEVEADYGLMPLDDIDDFKNIELCGVGGFNVTTPFKSSVIRYIDCDYSDCGSVNTLKVIRDGTIEGYSTDGKGFILDAKRLSLNLSRVQVTGYGGAAKSIVHELIKLNSQINIVSKHGGADSLNGFSGKPTLTVNCSGADCVSDAPCYDLRYLNCQQKTQNGLGMLIYQAILAQEIFLDRQIDLSLFNEIYYKISKEYL